MAWIESHQSLARHPKTRRLSRLLGISVPLAIGHLHLLWYWALDYAQDGDLTPFDAADLADCALWEGDPTLFVEAMTECGTGKGPGFLEVEDGALVIHDWHEYAGKLVEKRQGDADRKRASYRAKRRTPPPDPPVRSEGGTEKPAAGEKPTNDSPTRAEGQSGTDEQDSERLRQSGNDIPRPKAQPPHDLQRISSGYPADIAGNRTLPTVPTNPTNPPAAGAAGGGTEPRPRRGESPGAVAEFVAAYRTRYPEDPHVGKTQAVTLSSIRKELGEDRYRQALALYIADEEGGLLQAAHPAAFLPNRLDRIKARMNGSIGPIQPRGGPVPPNETQFRDWRQGPDWIRFLAQRVFVDHVGVPDEWAKALGDWGIGEEPTPPPDLLEQLRAA